MFSGDKMVDIRDRLKKSGAGEGEIFGLEEALARINIELINPTGNKLFTVSDVTAKEIFPLAYLLTIGRRMKTTMIHKWVENFLLLRISRFRLGRREFVFISGGLREVSERRAGGKAGLKDLFSGFR